MFGCHSLFYFFSSVHRLVAQDLPLMYPIDFKYTITGDQLSVTIVGRYCMVYLDKASSVKVRFVATRYFFFDIILVY